MTSTIPPRILIATTVLIAPLFAAAPASAAIPEDEFADLLPGRHVPTGCIHNPLGDPTCSPLIPIDVPPGSGGVPPPYLDLPARIDALGFIGPANDKDGDRVPDVLTIGTDRYAGTPPARSGFGDPIVVKIDDDATDKCKPVPCQGALPAFVDVPNGGHDKVDADGDGVYERFWLATDRYDTATRTKIGPGEDLVIIPDRVPAKDPDGADPCVPIRTPTRPECAQPTEITLETPYIDPGLISITSRIRMIFNVSRSSLDAGIFDPATQTLTDRRPWSFIEFQADGAYMEAPPNGGRDNAFSHDIRTPAGSAGRASWSAVGESPSGQGVSKVKYTRSVSDQVVFGTTSIRGDASQPASIRAEDFILFKFSLQKQLIGADGSMIPWNVTFRMAETRAVDDGRVEKGSLGKVENGSLNKNPSIPPSTVDLPPSAVDLPVSFRTTYQVPMWIDTKSPSIELSPPGPRIFTENQLAVRVSASDTTSPPDLACTLFRGTSTEETRTIAAKQGVLVVNTEFALTNPSEDTPFRLDCSSRDSVRHIDASTLTAIHVHDPTVTVATYEFDAGPPTLTVDFDELKYVGSTATLDVTSSDAHGVKLTYSLDNGTTQLIDQKGPGKVTISKKLVLSGLSSGIHQVVINATDNVGQTRSVSKIIRVDLSPPVTTLTIPAPDPVTGWYRTLPKATLIATDDGTPDRIYHKIGAGAAVETKGATAQVEIPEGKSVLLEYWSVDLAGNEEKPHRTATFKVDATAPSTTLTADPAAGGGDDGWYRAPPKITLAPSDALSGAKSTTYSVTVDGAASVTDAAYTAPFNLPRSGEVVVTYSSTDLAGNVEPERTSAVFRIDGDAPSTTVSIPDPDGDDGWHRTTPAATLTASDAPAGIRKIAWRLLLDGVGGDSGEITGATGAVHLPDGGNVAIRYAATDGAGNAEAEKTSEARRIDTVAPASTIAIAPDAPDGLDGWYRTAPTVTLSASDATSGVRATTYSIFVDGEATTSDATYAAPFLLPDGKEVAVHHQSKDVAGNLEATLVGPALKIDATPPKISGDGSDLWTREAGPYVVKVTIDDPASGVTDRRYLVSGDLARADVEMEGPFEADEIAIDDLAPGRHFVWAKASDAAGNEADWTLVSTIGVDRDSDSVTLDDPGAGSWTKVDTATFRCDAAKIVSPLKIHYTIGDGDPLTTECGSAITLPEGRSTVRFHAEDLAGNVGDESTGDLLRDYAAPTLSYVKTPTGDFSFRFDASASTDSGSGIDAIVWLFDEGTPIEKRIEGSEADWTAPLTGKRSLKVTVTDLAGNPASATETIAFADSSAPEVTLSVVSLGAGKTTLRAVVKDASPLASVAEAALNAGPALEIEVPLDLRYVGRSGAEVEFALDTPVGDHAASLRIADSEGNLGEATISFSVTGTPPPSLAKPADVAGTTGVEVAFPALVVTNRAASEIREAVWDFGDGSVPVTVPGLGVAKHTYATPGTYTVSATVTDTQSLSGSATFTATITARPPPLLKKHADQGATVNKVVTLRAPVVENRLVSEIARTTWNFGDGSDLVEVAGLADARHTYAAKGRYVVGVTVVDVAGASANQTFTVVVSDPPVSCRNCEEPEVRNDRGFATERPCNALQTPPAGSLVSVTRAVRRVLGDSACNLTAYDDNFDGIVDRLLDSTGALRVENVGAWFALVSRDGRAALLDPRGAAEAATFVKPQVASRTPVAGADEEIVRLRPVFQTVAVVDAQDPLPDLELVEIRIEETPIQSDQWSREGGRIVIAHRGAAIVYSLVYRVDTTPPETTLASFDPEDALRAPATLYFSTEAGAKTFYRIDDGTWTQGEEVSLDADGVLELDYYSVDAAGNRETPRNVLVRLDKSPPVVEGSYALPARARPGEAVLLGAVAHDRNGITSVVARITEPDGSLRELRLGATSSRTYALTYSPAGPGAYVVDLIATDGVGNSAGERVEFSVEPPLDPLPANPPVVTPPAPPQTSNPDSPTPAAPGSPVPAGGLIGALLALASAALVGSRRRA